MLVPTARVHCYNGMTGLHHREPGMVGAGLTDKRARLELIADGHHVHPAAMSLCCCCAKERIVLITDAMQAAGMPDGRYTLCGEEVQMHGGVVRTASGGLAGSTLSVDAAVRNMVELIWRNACGSHSYGIAASGANAGC